MIADIWQYLANEWLSMRELDNKNVSRRSLSVLWEVVVSVTNFFGRLTGVVRATARKVKVEHLVSIIRGLSVSVAAVFYNRETGGRCDVGVDKTDFFKVMQWIWNEVTTIDVGERIRERAISLP